MIGSVQEVTEIYMQYQIQNPEGFARMLKKIIETDRLPELVF